MLDAFERITLEAGAKGRYRTTFTVPDTYGIFKFRVHYRRPGYTVLSFSTQVFLCTIDITQLNLYCYITQEKRRSRVRFGVGQGGVIDRHDPTAN